MDQRQLEKERIRLTREISMLESQLSSALRGKEEKLEENKQIREEIEQLEEDNKELEEETRRLDEEIAQLDEEFKQAQLDAVRRSSVDGMGRVSAVYRYGVESQGLVEGDPMPDGAALPVWRNHRHPVVCGFEALIQGPQPRGIYAVVVCQQHLHGRFPYGLFGLMPAGAGTGAGALPPVRRHPLIRIVQYSVPVTTKT